VPWHSRALGGERSFAFVLPVDAAYPTETVKLDGVPVQVG
jgi:hypothetical protein